MASGTDKNDETEAKVPQVVTEGQARVTFPSAAEVFYNPVQEFNRDLSVAVIQLYVRKFLTDNPRFAKSGVHLLEALSASGLRSIRYAKEIEGLTCVVANDISEKAVKSIASNVKDNGVDDIVTVFHNDACMAMYQRRHPRDRFAVIDLDPYGSPTPFLDAAVQSVADDGLLCITCTDMAVLCGNAPETCYTKYGAVCLKSKCCHEMALRIVLQCVEAHANRYGRYVTPLLSLSIDFYCRVFVRVRSGQQQCKSTTSKLGHVYQCTGCESITAMPLGRLEEAELSGGRRAVKYKLGTGPPVGRECEFCGRPFHVGGPFWLAPIHDAEFLSELIDSLEEERFGTHGRMLGMLSVASEELHDVPFYYTQDRLCSLTRTCCGKLLSFRSALLNAGHRVSLSHANKHALKTDAPNAFVWRMMRAWERQNPVNRQNLSRDSVAWTLLSRGDDEGEAGDGSSSPKEVDFSLHADANPSSRALQLKRFQVNPERNWGPKTRAAQGTFGDDAKRRQNQGKKRKKQAASDSEADVEADSKRAAAEQSSNDASGVEIKT